MVYLSLSNKKKKKVSSFINVIDLVQHNVISEICINGMRFLSDVDLLELYKNNNEKIILHIHCLLIIFFFLLKKKDCLFLSILLIS